MHLLCPAAVHEVHQQQHEGEHLHFGQGAGLGRCGAGFVLAAAGLASVHGRVLACCSLRMHTHTHMVALMAVVRAHLLGTIAHRRDRIRMSVRCIAIRANRQKNRLLRTCTGHAGMHPARTLPPYTRTCFAWASKKALDSTSSDRQVAQKVCSRLPLSCLRSAADSRSGLPCVVLLCFTPASRSWTQV